MLRPVVPGRLHAGECLHPVDPLVRRRPLRVDHDHDRLHRGRLELHLRRHSRPHRRRGSGGARVRRQRRWRRHSVHPLDCHGGADLSGRRRCTDGCRGHAAVRPGRAVVDRADQSGGWRGLRVRGQSRQWRDVGADRDRGHEVHVHRSHQRHRRRVPDPRAERGRRRRGRPVGDGEAQRLRLRRRESDATAEHPLHRAERSSLHRHVRSSWVAEPASRRRWSPSR